MLSPVPSLSQDGWVTDTAMKADYLLAQLFETNYSQSVLYAGAITSFQYLIQKYGDNPAKLIEVSIDKFQTYFQRYFNNVLVEVLVPPDPNDGSASIYKIYLSFDDVNGTRFNIGKLGTMVDSKFVAVINDNDFGT